MTTIDTIQHAHNTTTAGADIDHPDDFQRALLVLARTGDGTAALASIAAARQQVREILDTMKCRNPEAGE